MNERKILNHWADFLQDINVPRPVPLALSSIRLTWCPDGTNDSACIQQSRPLLRQLLEELIDGEPISAYVPPSWQGRESYQSMLRSAGMSFDARGVFPEWAVSNLSEVTKDDFRSFDRDSLNRLVLHFHDVALYDAELYKNAAETRNRLNSLQERLEKAHRVNDANQSPSQDSRRELLDSYNSEVIGRLENALTTLEGVRTAIQDDLRDMVLDSLMRSFVDVQMVEELPSMDDLAKLIEELPDLSDVTSQVQLEATYAANALDEKLKRFSEDVAKALHLDENKIDIKRGAGAPRGPIYVNIINASEDAKVYQQQNPTTISSESPGDD